MEQRDIVIAGGGMVGVSLALQLAERLPAGLQITLVEGFALPGPGSAAQYHPSFDARSTALSYSSQKIYQAMGVWDELEHWLCPIERIHVSSRGRFGSTVMQASDYGWPSLGHVVENAWLGNALLQALHRQGRVELISPARVTDLKPLAQGVELQLEGAEHECFTAQLLVVADGADSSLRESLGVAVDSKSYGQSAVVCNVAFAESHQNCAFERFTADGPLALLPLLSARQGEHRSTLIWSLPPERAEHLAACDEEEFLSALQTTFGYRLGRMRQVGKRHCYPLVLLQSCEQLRQGVVVMGNAAHTLHPVAGQGFNLALRDVAQLAEALASAPDKAPLGALSVLQAYQQRQQQDQWLTIGASDALPELFMRSDPVFGLLRDLALSGLDVLSPLKREFVRYAAGLAALGGSRLER
ncbi:2-octaprenyl-6-methoxyphenyl hydroxylase [Parahaliea sp. F7430]|uniref:2-octaprenyl-6-methoxyphenyl hydroxylase n=1 Tax=Sediminihaliea albiluteola TaxID=2758564 RepID=A0A7W2TX16_9GAMM|nr:2-octaprenyl-6-methoxyphenyl hydroxylase [Sediminihaliea albiluteola]MBA6413528.1 2-octaprenyl-6-methoxyphenyl hydroxylase [Sediminihaliea albiluteola]